MVLIIVSAASLSLLRTIIVVTMSSGFLTSSSLMVLPLFLAIKLLTASFSQETQTDLGNILDELRVGDLVDVERSECDFDEVYTAGKLQPFREDSDDVKLQDKVVTLRSHESTPQDLVAGRAPKTYPLPSFLLTTSLILFMHLVSDNLQVRDPDAGVAGEACRVYHLADAQAVPDSQAGLGKQTHNLP